jgi:hypothetical protein
MPIDPKQAVEWKSDAEEIVREQTDLDARDANSADRNRAFDLNAPIAMDLAREAVPALLAEREEMLAVLREVEWSARADVIDEVPIEEAQACPACLAIQRTGHAPGCRLAALLRGP